MDFVFSDNPPCIVLYRRCVNTRHQPNAGSMLVQRRRSWPNIDPALSRIILFVTAQVIPRVTPPLELWRTSLILSLIKYVATGGASSPFHLIISEFISSGARSIHNIIILFLSSIIVANLTANVMLYFVVLLLEKRKLAWEKYCEAIREVHCQSGYYKAL